MKQLLFILIFFHFNFLLGQEGLYVSAANGLIVRSQPSKNSKRIGKLPFAEKIVDYSNTNRFDEIIDEGTTIKGEWYYITAYDIHSNKIAGYVFNSFLTPKVLKKKLNYFEFKPDPILDFQLGSFSINNMYRLDSFKIINGYYEPKDGKIVLPDTEDDYGHRILMLNAQDKIIYQSQGFGEAYSFEPHFYKNNKSEKVIIICQLAFEYCFGGEVFIYENGKIKHIGLLDIESTSEEKCLIDIIKIHEVPDEIIFSFNSATLLLEPGTEDVEIKNKGTTYTYIDGKLVLKK